MLAELLLCLRPGRSTSKIMHGVIVVSLSLSLVFNPVLGHTQSNTQVPAERFSRTRMGPVALLTDNKTGQQVATIDGDTSQIYFFQDNKFMKIQRYEKFDDFEYHETRYNQGAILNVRMAKSADGTRYTQALSSNLELYRQDVYYMKEEAFPTQKKRERWEPEDGDWCGQRTQFLKSLEGLKEIKASEPKGDPVCKNGKSKHLEHALKQELLNSKNSVFRSCMSSPEKWKELQNSGSNVSAAAVRILRTYSFLADKLSSGSQIYNLPIKFNCEIDESLLIKNQITLKEIAKYNWETDGKEKISLRTFPPANDQKGESTIAVSSSEKGTSAKDLQHAIFHELIHAATQLPDGDPVMDELFKICTTKARHMIDGNSLKGIGNQEARTAQVQENNQRSATSFNLNTVGVRESLTAVKPVTDETFVAVNEAVTNPGTTAVAMANAFVSLGNPIVGLSRIVASGISQAIAQDDMRGSLSESPSPSKRSPASSPRANENRNSLDSSRESVNTNSKKLLIGKRGAAKSAPGFDPDSFSKNVPANSDSSPETEQAISLAQSGGGITDDGDSNQFGPTGGDANLGSSSGLTASSKNTRPLGATSIAVQAGNDKSNSSRSPNRMPSSEGSRSNLEVSQLEVLQTADVISGNTKENIKKLCDTKPEFRSRLAQQKIRIEFKNNRNFGAPKAPGTTVFRENEQGQLVKNGSW